MIISFPLGAIYIYIIYTLFLLGNPKFSSLNLLYSGADEFNNSFSASINTVFFLKMVFFLSLDFYLEETREACLDFCYFNFSLLRIPKNLSILFLVLLIS